MHADAVFSIGRTHKICQDYAAVGDPESPLVVLSDGCSSSLYTDVGSRLLVISTLQDCTAGGLRIINKASHMAEAAGLPKGCLDATLLYAYEERGMVRVLAYGDGVVSLRRKATGKIETWSIDYGNKMEGSADFGSEVPAYLSYLLSASRSKAYLSRGNGRRIITRYVDGQEVEKSEEMPSPEEAFDKPFTLLLDPAHIELVCLFSDGVRSFARDLETGGIEPVSMHEVISHLMAIRSPNGEFMTRRHKMFLTRHCAKEHWHHHDDLSIGAIWCGEEST